MEGYNKNLIQVQAIKNVSQLLRHITSVGNTVDTRVDVTQETLTCNTGNVCLCLCGGEGGGDNSDIDASLQHTNPKQKYIIPGT